MTAIEWLVERLAENGIIHSCDISKAKEMEKEQIIDAFFEGKNDGILMERYSDYNHITPNEYYNETYKNTKE
jgi:hypothetical protein